MKITTKETRETVKLLKEIVEEYKKETPSKEKNWRTEEERTKQRLRTAFISFRPLVKEAVSSIEVVRGENRGVAQKLNLEQKVLLLLLKQLIGKSNRNMSFMLSLFLWLTDIDVSYKTIERLYSDQEVRLALHNLHVLILKKKGVGKADCSGDGTGYALTVKKHYATEAQRLKDKMKKHDRRKKREFIFSFAMMDITSRMYVGYGTSFKSEQQAHVHALEMCKESGVDISSMRLDRLFSCQSCVKVYRDAFDDVKMYLIPKSNATVKGPWDWKRMLYRFVHATKPYLKEYYQRNQSESGISEDKRRTGWKLGQKRADRIDTADKVNKLWHNLYWLG